MKSFHVLRSLNTTATIRGELMTVRFTDEERLAKYVAQLVREGVRFIIHNVGCNEYEVELTGGF